MTAEPAPAEPEPESSRGDERPGLALFDFDGTLTRRDTVLPFLLGVCGNDSFPRLTMAAARAFAGGADTRRDAAKGAVIMHALQGRAHSEVQAVGRAYARSVVKRALRPDARARLEWHRTRGHRLALVSASLEPYLTVVAEHLAIDTCLCTRLEVDGSGVLTGSMLGPNCRGAEKARRVREVFELETFEVWAYGDTSGDESLLALADHPVWVGRRARRVSQGSQGNSTSRTG